MRRVKPAVSDRSELSRIRGTDTVHDPDPPATGGGLGGTVVVCWVVEHGVKAGPVEVG